MYNTVCYMLIHNSPCWPNVFHVKTNKSLCKPILPLTRFMFTHKHWYKTMGMTLMIHGRTNRHTFLCVCVCIHTCSLSVSQIQKITFQRTFCSNINLGHGRPAKSHTGVLTTSHTHCFQTPWPEMTGLICPTGRVISLRICVWEMRRAHPLISLPFPDPRDWQI